MAKDKKALVISGGGSKGAYAGGISEYLINELDRDYDIHIGTSTGNLLGPLLSIGEIAKLKTIYTSVTQNDIWNLNPFKMKGDLLNMNLWNIFKSTVIRRNNSLGEAENFKDLIREILTERDYRIIKHSGKDVISCVTNLTKSRAEYKSTRDYERKAFIEWMYASSCVPPFMPALQKESGEYVDGGLTEHVPIQEAINRGATEIDVVELKQESPDIGIERVKNPLHYLLRSIETMMKDISKNDFAVDKLDIKDNPININIYFATRKLTQNSLVFDPEQMKAWWDEGYYVASTGGFRSYFIDEKRIIKTN